MKREELRTDKEKAFVPLAEDAEIRSVLSAEDAEDAAEPMTIEETFEELDNLLEMLEQSESSLEASFRYFERGMKLVKQCSAQIDKVEKQIILLSEEDEGE